jgi:hypothetical protein
VTEFRFEVTVRVDDWPDSVPVYDDGLVRTARDYAESALYSASLREAGNLDGFADLDGPDAHITDVTFLDEH